VSPTIETAAHTTHLLEHNYGDNQEELDFPPSKCAKGTGAFEVPGGSPTGFSSGRRGQLNLQSSQEIADAVGVKFRRQLSTKISWSAIVGESQEDDVTMESTPKAMRNRSSCELTFRSSLLPIPIEQPSSPVAADSPRSSPLPSRRGFRRTPSWIMNRPAKPGRNRDDPLNLDRDNTGRFARDFENLQKVGSGHFSDVYKARNRVDGQEYAIKKTKEPLALGAVRRREMLQEALALASLAMDSTCPYIVRYFSSWIEDERLMIQTELCDGSLKDEKVALQSSCPEDPRMGDLELSSVIRDVCTGLEVLHRKNLVHLDVKPENILVKRLLPTPNRDATSRIYKIADLGLATAAIGSGCDEICEGDSRYLAREVLQGNFSDLTKADVFALGLVCYELATNPKELPCNGNEWQSLRDGHLEVSLMNQSSDAMVALVRRMAHPDSANRPPCTEILKDTVLNRKELSELEDDAKEDMLPRSCLEELQRQLRQTTDAAERERHMREDAEQKAASAERRAAQFWSELLQAKSQKEQTGEMVVGERPLVLDRSTAQRPRRSATA